MALKFVKVGKIYRNIKNENLYRVKSVGFHTENEEITVHYEPLDKRDAAFSDYYRPMYGMKGFLQKFELPREAYERELARRITDVTPVNT